MPSCSQAQMSEIYAAFGKESQNLIDQIIWGHQRYHFAISLYLLYLKIRRLDTSYMWHVSVHTKVLCYEVIKTSMHFSILVSSC